MYSVSKSLLFTRKYSSQRALKMSRLGGSAFKDGEYAQAVQYYTAAVPLATLQVRTMLLLLSCCCSCRRSCCACRACACRACACRACACACACACS